MKASHKCDFEAFVKKNRYSRFIIAMHRNGDIDALAAAYALQSVFTNSIVAVSDKMDENATSLAAVLGMDVKMLDSLDKKEFDGWIVVDTNTYELLKEARGQNIKLIIDHHHADEHMIKAETEIRDEDAPSTAEIVASLLPDVDGKVAFALACGIISDTARFKNGRAETFAIVAELIKKSGKSYIEILCHAEPERSPNTKIAVLKSFQRVKMNVVKNFVVATSDVGSNESDASSALAEVADIVFVASWKEEEKESRVSSRARKGVPIQLNEIMYEVASRFNGKGGGHPKAAGCSAKARPEEVLQECVKVIIEKL